MPAKHSRTTESNGQPKRGLALLFPGQGSQHAGMGKRLYEISHAARRVFDRADKDLGFSVSGLCFEGSEEELEDTVNTQPAILTTSIAYLADLRERLAVKGRQLRPSFVAGHSLGQFTAAVAAGALDFSDGLRLVLERGRIMAERVRSRPGGMATILGMNEEDIAGVCREASPEGNVRAAVFNGPAGTVISGDVEPLLKAMQLARERGGRVLRLPISVPGHTPIMGDAGRELSKFISALPFRDPDPPVVSNISAKFLTRADEVRQELSDQLVAAVQWARCVLAMANHGAGVFIEVGPGHSLSKMVRRIAGDAKAIGTDGTPPEDVLALVESLPLPAAATIETVI
jgi:[acyl-carrier-protein] S-malonyltransferase